MKAPRTLYFCGDCGNEYAKWQGQCPACKAWNTMVEQPAEAPVAVPKGQGRAGEKPVPRTLPDISVCEEVRFETGLSELDRVLGGGAVAGSLVLVSGEPGIGKSTLLLQICKSLARRFTVLYVSGEESLRQIKLRADRLRVSADKLFLLSETEITRVLDAVETLKPDVLIVDSIQTMYRAGGNTTPGNVTQVKECTLSLMQLAKGQGVTVFLIGHVNKDGAIAGPKVLEHMVDSVLYFEGDRHLSYRVLRAAKNRFGSVSEIGMFDMREEGLVEVPNPSEFLLSGRPHGVSGTCVACAMEGTRPVLCEVQSLVTQTSFGQPRRTVSGLDYNRVMLLLAVLEKRAGVYVGNCDVYVNVVGGFELEEPAADLPVLLACASSARDKALPGDLCAMGEVGLGGELRAVGHMEQRVAELFRLGFKKCILPRQGTQTIMAPEGLELVRARYVRDALAAL